MIKENEDYDGVLFLGVSLNQIYIKYDILFETLLKGEEVEGLSAILEK